MSAAELSAPLCAFLREHIESYEQLEFLLFLRRRYDEWWTGAAIEASLPLRAEDADAWLEALLRHDLLDAKHDDGPKPRYRYSRANPAIALMVDELAIAFTDVPLEIAKVMTANAMERLRTRSVGVFPRAFSLRKTDKGIAR